MKRRMIKVSSTGPEVEELQTTLNNLGYELDIDGEFGKSTLKAVQDFQKSAGLPTDGIVGEQTWDALELSASENTNDITSEDQNAEVIDDQAESDVAVELSYSVDNLRNIFRSENVSSLKIVRQLVDTHPDYISDENKKKLKGLRENKKYQTRTVDEWIKAVLDILDLGKVKAAGRFHGRLFILGLVEIDPELNESLKKNGIYEDMKTRPPFRELQKVDLKPDQKQETETDTETDTASGKKTENEPDDPNRILPDQPVSVDKLGRKGFALGLLKYIDLVYKGVLDSSKKNASKNLLKKYWQWWCGNKASSKNELRSNQENEKCFVLHLGGPWGSGKSTIMQIMLNGIPLRNNKYAKKKGEDILDLEDWIPVWFNAWRQQHITPVFWPLMDQIFGQAIDDMKASKHSPFFRKIINRAKAFRLRWYEKFWRYTAGNKTRLVLFGLSILSLSVFFYLLRTNQLTFSDTPGLKEAFEILGALVGIIVATWSGIELIRNSLIGGSSEWATKYITKTKDPIHNIRDHFYNMLDKFNRPVVVFVDDLDRCKSAYVVEFLENIQTLFNSNKLYFVVAADRRWIYTCFENKYTEFKSIVREPGKRLGYLFLEKAIQISVSVPIMKYETQQEYLDNLYGFSAKKGQEELKRRQKEIDEEIDQANTDESRGMTLFNLDKDEHPIVKEYYVNKIIEKSVTKEAAREIEYFLRNFVHLLERNPRAIKRYVNAFNVFKMSAFSLAPNVMFEKKLKTQYTLWMIMVLRWPKLAEMLEEDPDMITYLKDKTQLYDQDWMDFINNEEVLNVVNGEGCDGIQLDKKAVIEFSRLNPLQYVTSSFTGRENNQEETDNEK